MLVFSMNSLRVMPGFFVTFFSSAIRVPPFFELFYSMFLYLEGDWNGAITRSGLNDTTILTEAALPFSLSTLDVNCARGNILNYHHLLRRPVNRRRFTLSDDIVVAAEAVRVVCNSDGMHRDIHVGSQRHGLIRAQGRPLYEVVTLPVTEEPTFGAKSLANHKLIVSLEQIRRLGSRHQPRDRAALCFLGNLPHREQLLGRVTQTERSAHFGVKAARSVHLNHQKKLIARVDRAVGEEIVPLTR